MKKSAANFPPWLGSFRTCLPSSSVLAFSAFLIVGLEGLWLFTRLAIDFEFFPLSEKILLVRDHLLILMATCYGAYRVFCFHPIVQSDYLSWLKLTPWKKGTPLPLGPVSVCVWDAVILLAFVLLLMDGRDITIPGLYRPAAVMPVISFLISYCLSLSFVVWLTDQRLAAYLSFGLLAMCFGLSQWPLLAMAFLFAAFAVAGTALSSGWTEFPWDDLREARKNWRRRYQTASVNAGQLVDGQESPDKIPVAELGWPFSVCSPVKPTPGLGKAERCLIAGLVGLWFVCLSQLLTADMKKGEAIGPGYFLVIGYTTAGLALWRLGRTFSQFKSPISLMGRLRTGRWIIPEFDKAIFGIAGLIATPVLMTIMGAWWLQLSMFWLGPFMLVCTLWANILIGPDLDTWKLTAPSRLSPGTLNKRAFDQLT